MIPSWSASELGEALEALARASGIAVKPGAAPRPPERTLIDRTLQEQWIDATAAWFGMELEPLELPAADVEAALSGCAPALLKQWDSSVVVLLERARVLGPDLSVRRVTHSALASQLAGPVEARFAEQVDRVLDDIDLRGRRRAKARAQLLRECIRDQRIDGCWSVRVPPRDAWQAIKQSGLPSLLAALLTAHVVEYGLWIASWWLIGTGALQGRFDRSWLLAWALLLATLIPVRAAITWCQGLTATVAGGLLKERLLAGALRLDADEVRQQGTGQLLGRVIESELLEGLALNGGFLALSSSIELAMAAVVLAAGAGGLIHLTLLVVWTTLTLALAWRYFATSRAWTHERLSMTQDLVERLIGHRTRLVQEAPERRHDDEDQLLERYLGSSQRLDRAATWLAAVVPLGWLITGVLGLAWPFVSGSASTAALAIGVGGTVLAWEAFGGFTTGLWNLVGAAIAWNQVASLFRAAARPETYGAPELALRPAPVHQQTLLDLQEVVFRYDHHVEPVLRGCSLRLAAGDRIVLTGASGAGKSTFASVLAGLRAPQSGLLLADGLDRGALGVNGWHRTVAFAPQFHENHVLSASLAFNLLMSRGAILDEKNLEEAEAICRELGLEEVIARMPAGMLQMVGETGWQLSHGERSRLFIARALLQRADVIVLDEGFAALDPWNLRRALECIARRATAALVIAHT